MLASDKKTTCHDSVNSVDLVTFYHTWNKDHEYVHHES